MQLLVLIAFVQKYLKYNYIETHTVIYKNELYNENFPLDILLTEQKLNGYSLAASNLLGHGEPGEGNIWKACKVCKAAGYCSTSIVCFLVPLCCL